VVARICPHCKTERPAAEVAAHSDSVECPECGTRLEVAPGTRGIASFCGLAAAAIAWRLTSGSTSDLGGVLPTLYAFLAFGVVSPLALMFTANLRNAPAIPVPEPAHAPSAAGHGGGHH
jgi:hypothetical protein